MVAKGELPYWAWSAGMLVGLIMLGDILLNGVERGFGAVVGEAVGALLAFTIAASAKP